MIVNGLKDSQWTVANKNQLFGKVTDGEIQKVIMYQGLGCNKSEGAIITHE